MNLYRYRVVERTTTIEKDGKTRSFTWHYLQRSVLGIMWADIGSFGHDYDAIDAYNTKKVTKVKNKDKVIHPIKQIK
jgi:hypothetical protein